jgi:hypothetical protein
MEVMKMTALQQWMEQSNPIVELKKEAVRTGINKVTYTNGLGQARTEYYHSCRWNDRPAAVGAYTGI